jgi:hypothetical protein
LVQYPASAHFWIGTGGAHGNGLFLFNQMISNRYIDDLTAYSIGAFLINLAFASIIAPIMYLVKKYVIKT